MAALWTYPWTLDREGIDETCETLTAHGIDGVNVASHYHSVRSMQARFPDDLFRAYPGGCYFEPGDRFDETPIDPPVNRVGSWDDPLAEIVDGVHDHGMDVNAWTVCLHNSRLGATNPDYRFESAFGDAHDHSLCPSHPEVREYFAAVVGSIRDRGVDEIQLESVGFPSAFHDHGTLFGHDKRQAVTTDAEDALLSQCFCAGCQEAAASHAVDFEAARTRVRERCRQSLSDPTVSHPAIDGLVDQDPVLADLFDFRASVIETFLERLADASGSTPINYYVMEASGSSPADLFPSGVRFDHLEKTVDKLTAICYVPDAETARGRIETLEGLVDLPVDAGITLDPGVLDSCDQLLHLVDGIRPTISGALSIYHHSLATETHLEWIADALAEPQN